jgi:hypothetical protein
MARYKGVFKILAGVSVVFWGFSLAWPAIDYYGGLENISGFQAVLPLIAFLVPLLWGTVLVVWGVYDTFKGAKSKDKKGGKLKWRNLR